MWDIQENKLYKKFKFANFPEAIEFVNQVARISEIENHHPSIHINYHVIDIWLCTHDSNNQITEKDYMLANMIDEIK
jgi:4a-hydroxytetrahydrobiopterin dehydratase